jgi:hypothetical protein
MDFHGVACGLSFILLVGSLLRLPLGFTCLKYFSLTFCDGSGLQMMPKPSMDCYHIS